MTNYLQQDSKYMSCHTLFTSCSKTGPVFFYHAIFHLRELAILTLVRYNIE